MELHYYKYIEEEGYTHETWKYMTAVIRDCVGNYIADYEKGWVKQRMPSNLSKREEVEWRIKSNREDLHFIAKESEACRDWYMEHLDDIIKGQKSNKKILESLV